MKTRTWDQQVSFYYGDVGLHLVVFAGGAKTILPFVFKLKFIHHSQSLATERSWECTESFLSRRKVTEQRGLKRKTINQS